MAMLSAGHAIRLLRRLAVTVPFLGMSCFSPEPGSDVEVLFYSDSLVAPRELTVRLTHPGGQLVLHGADFTTKRYATPHSDRYPVSASGEMQVTVVLEKAGSDTVAVGSLVVPLSPNLHYGVDVFVGTQNPGLACLGCVGVAAFPLRGSLAARPDSLFLVWGASAPGTIVYDSRAVIDSTRIRRLSEPGLATVVLTVPDPLRFDWRFILAIAGDLTSADSFYIVQLGGRVVAMLHAVDYIAADLPDRALRGSPGDASCR